MFEVVVGMLLLLLGCLCFKQVLCTNSYTTWSPMFVRTILGLLLILGGAALLALGIFEQVRETVSF